MDLGNNEQAKKYFEIAKNKNNINAYIYLGKIYFDEGKYEESKDTLKYLQMTQIHIQSIC